MPKWIALALLVFTVRAASAQMTSVAAYDTVQQLRARADTLLGRDTVAAIATLRDALDFLKRQEVRDLAQGSPYLRARASNVWWDIALISTLRSDTSAALSAFEMVQRTGGTSGYISGMRNDAIASRWKGNPRYETVIAKLRQQGRMWRDSAFISPFQDTLTGADRVAGLSLMWAEVRYAYPDFGQHPQVDWDSLYQAYLPRVLTTSATYDYYRLLQRFVAELGDAHTNVYFPPEISSQIGRPPIRTRLVDGRVLVTDVMSSSVAERGVRIGDEIEAVDDASVFQYADSAVKPYQSSATQQDLEIRLYRYALLYGPVATPVALRVRHADGTRANVLLARSGYTDVRRTPPPVTDTVLAGNVGYLRIATFGVDSVGAWVRRSMTRLMGTAALIIDIRENDGGSTIFDPLPVLARAPSPASAGHVRNYSALDRARGLEPQPFELSRGIIRPSVSQHYDAPVALLIGPQTFSAGEDFAVAFDLMKRGTIVGEPSGGNTGQPMTFSLPGNGSARVRTKHDDYGDGREFLFVGVQPQVVVRPTVAGVRAGRDETLEAALRLLRP